MLRQFGFATRVAVEIKTSFRVQFIPRISFVVRFVFTFRVHDGWFCGNQCSRDEWIPSRRWGTFGVTTASVFGITTAADPDANTDTVDELAIGGCEVSATGSPNSLQKDRGKH